MCCLEQMDAFLGIDFVWAPLLFSCIRFDPRREKNGTRGFEFALIDSSPFNLEFATCRAATKEEEEDGGA